jgi:2-methylcitrate dehydratase PrpD
MTQEGLSQRLARHVLATPFEALDPTVIQSAQRSIADAVAVTLATGRFGGECNAYVELARDSGRGACTVIGRGFSASPVMAAFANGAMAHVLDFEDTHDETMMHPHAAVIPAALAAAELRGGVSGKDLLAAIVLGADISCRIARGVVADPSAGHWYLLPMIAAYGAAAAAGRVLGLGQEQLIDAFSLAASQATYSAQLRRSPESHLRGVRDAYAAGAGVTGVLLAGKGARGYEQPLEGASGFFQMHGQQGWSEERVLDRLGADYLGALVSFKPWPCCRGTHAHIAAAMHLMRTDGISAADVKSVHAVIAPIWQMLCEPPAQKREPRTEIDAKFSLPFTVGLALVRGAVRLEDFGEPAVSDPAILAIAAKLTWEVNPAWTFRDATAGTLVIETHDGRNLRHQVTTPPGHPENPLKAEETREKLLACAKHAAVPISDDAVDTFLHRCAHLAELNDVRELLTTLS